MIQIVTAGGGAELRLIASLKLRKEEIESLVARLEQGLNRAE